MKDFHLQPFLLFAFNVYFRNPQKNVKQGGAKMIIRCHVFYIRLRMQ